MFRSEMIELRPLEQNERDKTRADTMMNITVEDVPFALLQHVTARITAEVRGGEPGAVRPDRQAYGDYREPAKIFTCPVENLVYNIFVQPRNDTVLVSISGDSGAFNCFNRASYKVPTISPACKEISISFLIFTSPVSARKIRR